MHRALYVFAGAAAISGHCVLLDEVYRTPRNATASQRVPFVRSERNNSFKDEGGNDSKPPPPNAPWQAKGASNIRPMEKSIKRPAFRVARKSASSSCGLAPRARQKE